MLSPVSYENRSLTVSARDLHEKSEVQTQYRIWFPRMCEYGFTEGVDFNPYKNVRVQTEGNRKVNRDMDDHMISLSMAKELCMLQRTEKGKFFRQYFIRVEFYRRDRLSLKNERNFLQPRRPFSPPVTSTTSPTQRVMPLSRSPYVRV